jgi:hypothetical protein
VNGAGRGATHTTRLGGSRGAFFCFSVFACLWVCAVAGAVGCPAVAYDNGPDVLGVGDPCSSDGTLGDLCLDTLICVEPVAGSGGACAVGPDDCAAASNDDFCDCDTSSLCDGDTAPDQCFVVDGRRGIACQAAP